MPTEEEMKRIMEEEANNGCLLPAVTRQKPTIAELETILNSGEKLSIAPNGDVIKEAEGGSVGIAYNPNLIFILTVSSLGKLALKYYEQVCGTREQAQECLNLTVMHVAAEIQKQRFYKP